MLFADSFAISASSVLAYGRTLRATRHRPRSLSTKITRPPFELVTSRTGLAWVALLALLVLIGCGKTAPTDEEANTIRIGAASDLSKAFEEVAKAYEKKTGRKTKLTFGSTGLLSKQIIDGAPFDVFAAANVSFVDEVVAKGGCDGSTKALYARGRIVM